MYNLLVVDDEKQSRNTLSNCFPWETIGFHVIGQASNGAEALQFLESHKVHVILCDILMPVISGIELAKKISTWEEPPCMVFLSGYRSFEYAQQALAYNVRFYILKPAKYEDLHQTFSTVKLELDSKYNVLEADAIQSDLFLDNIKQYIINHYQTANLKEAAQSVYMNPSYVSQLFKQQSGQNFSDYLLEVKMNKAATFLTNPNIKIYEIATQVGYSNAKNFSRTFKNFHGKSPKEFREHHLFNILPEDKEY